MGTSSQAFTTYVLEQLGALPSLTTDRFFGGLAVKSGPVQFAMIMDGSLYFTVDEASRGAYEAMGSRPFAYETKKGRVQVRKYFEVPADLLDDPERLAPLARQALAAAASAKAPKRPKGRS